jgi:two-component system sensor kinase FixL
MTSALAHQVNQPITALNSYLAACRLLLKATPPDIARAELLMDKAVAEAQRAGDVVSGLRDFYQRGTTRPERIPIVNLIDNAVEGLFLQGQRNAVILTTRHADRRACVCADRLQIENALQNVVMNAIDAVETVETTRKSVELSTSMRGARIEIRIRDNGPGVGSDMVENLFEPFMTSKATGLGMGLTIARSLVRASSGDLRLESSGLSGACFLLSLPESNAPEEDQ